MSEHFDPYHKWLGIPPEEQPADNYRLLGVARFETDLDVIEGAADRQMAHVQKHKLGANSAASQKLLNELAAAKITLLNPTRRAAYDRALRARLGQQSSQVTAPTPAAPAPSSPAAPAAVAGGALDFVNQQRASGETPTRREASAKGKRPQQTKRGQQVKKSANLVLIIVPVVLAIVGVVGIVAWRFSASDSAKPAKQTASKPAKARKTEPAQPGGKAPSREEISSVPKNDVVISTPPSAKRSDSVPAASTAPAVSTAPISPPLTAPPVLGPALPGSKVLQPETDAGKTKCVAISSDGKLVFWSGLALVEQASGQTRGTLRSVVWNVQSGSQTNVLSGESRVQKAAFTPDGKQLVVLTTSAVVVLELPGTRVLRSSPLPATTGMQAFALGPDASCYAFLESEKHTMAFHDVQSGDMLFRTPELRGNVGVVALSADAKYAYVGGKLFDPTQDRGVFNRVFDLRVKSEIAIDFGRSTYAVCNALVPQGMVAMLSTGKQIQIWNLQQKTMQISLPLGVDSSTMAFTADGGRLLSALSGGVMRLWNVTARQPIADFKDPAATMSAGVLQISADGETAVSANQKGGVVLWSLAAAGAPQPGPVGPATAIATAPAIEPARPASPVPPSAVLATTQPAPPAATQPAAPAIAQVTPVSPAPGDKTTVPVTVLQQSSQHLSTRGAAISPDGNWLFWSGVTNLPGPNGFQATFTNILWNLRDGTQKSVLPTEKKLGRVMFTPDSKHLIGLRMENATMWEIPMLREERVTNFPKTGGLMGGDFVLSEDGSMMARFESNRRTAWFVDFQSGEVLFRTPDMELDGQKLAISPDAKLALVGGAILENGKPLGYSNRIYDLVAKKQLPVDLNRPGSVPLDARFVGPDTLAMRSSDRKEIQLWSVSKQVVHTTLPCDSNLSNIMAFTPDGKRMLQANNNETVKLWDVPSQQILEQFPLRPGGNPRVLLITPDGRKGVYACDQGSVVLLTPRPLQPGELPAEAPPVVALAAANMDSAKPLAPPLALQHSRRFTYCVAISPDGKMVFWSGNGQGPINVINRDNVLWDLHMEPPNVLKAPSSPERATFSSDGKQLFMLTGSEAIAVEVPSMRVLASARLPVTSVTNTLAIASDASCFGIFDKKNQAVLVHDTRTGGLIFQTEFPGNGTILTLSPGARHAFVGSGLIENHRAVGHVHKLFDLQTKREVPINFARNTYAQVNAFSPNGDLAMVSNDHKNIEIWNLRNKRLQSTISKGPDHTCMCMAFTPDGERLFTPMSGGIMRLWNVTTGELLAQLKDPGNQANTAVVAVSGDGRWAATAEQSGGVRRWSLVVDGLPAPGPAIAVSPPVADPQAPLAPPPLGPATASVVKPPLQAKLPTPDEAELQTALMLIKEVYGDDYTKAKKPSDKVALSEKLQSQAAQSQNSAEKYVLLAEARDLAATAGDPGQFFKSLEALQDLFAADTAEMTLTAANQFTDRMVPKQRHDLAAGALSLVERALREEHYDVAEKLVELALPSARKAKDPVLLKQIVERKGEVQDFKKQETEIIAARETLAKTADDPAANLAMGRFYCLLKNDWARGLPMLARSNDESLRDLATQEAAEPKTSADHVKLADGWYAVAQGAAGNDKTKYLSRAEQWYRKAAAELTGITLLKVQKRLEELDAGEAK